MANPEVEEWLRTAEGVAMNPDRAYGLQCVDVIDQFAQDLTGVHWSQSVGGVVSANQLLDVTPDAYWIRIDNDPSNRNQLPERGDFVIFGGDGVNPHGHVAAVLSASRDGAEFLQQDGSNRTRPVHKAWLGWDQVGTGHVTGWLRLRDSVIRNTGAAARV